MDILTIIFSIIIVLISVIVHEVSHGYMALWLGDPTAKYEGRLTLNPLKHLDPVGSIIVPILTSLLGFTIGWAKPVPFNPYNLRNRRWGEALVAVAGPLSNILIAIVFSVVIRILLLQTNPNAAILFISELIVLINLSLAIFNLVPIPPLDGSKILFAIFPRAWGQVRATLERFQFVLVLIFIFFLWQYVTPLISIVFHAFTGVIF